MPRTWKYGGKEKLRVRKQEETLRGNRSRECTKNTKERGEKALLISGGIFTNGLNNGGHKENRSEKKTVWKSTLIPAAEKKGEWKN